MKKYIRLFDIGIQINIPVDFRMFQEFAKFESTTPYSTVKYLYTVRVISDLLPTGDRIYSIENMDIYANHDCTERCFPRYDHMIDKSIYGAILSYRNSASCKERETKIELLFSETMLEMYGNRLVVSQFMGLERVLLQNQGLLLHASLINYKGKGIVFTAPSGTGKSTQAELWGKYRNAEIINGDRAGIRLFADKELRAYGSPLSGSSGIVKNQDTQLCAIVVLKQAEENRAKKMSEAEAFRAVYRETLMNTWDSWYMETMSELLINIVHCIPVFLLECRPDEGAVFELERVLKEGGEKWQI